MHTVQCSPFSCNVPQNFLDCSPNVLAKFVRISCIVSESVHPMFHNFIYPHIFGKDIQNGRVKEEDGNTGLLRADNVDIE